VAPIRAEESPRSDRLFDDRCAATLAAAAPRAVDREQRAATARVGAVVTGFPAFWPHAVLGTRFVDDITAWPRSGGQLSWLVDQPGPLRARPGSLARPTGLGAGTDDDGGAQVV